MSPFLRLRGAHLTSFPVLEDFVFTALSVIVAVVALSHVLMQPSASIAASVNAAGAAVNPKQVVFYGTLVDASGQPIKNAVIEVQYADGTRVASSRTKADGSWSLQFNDGPAPFTITVTVIENGVPVTGEVQVAATPGMRWGIQMVFTQPSTWVFVPLPGY